MKSSGVRKSKMFLATFYGALMGFTGEVNASSLVRLVQSDHKLSFIARIISRLMNIAN